MKEELAQTKEESQVMKAEHSRLIPRKLTETLELSNVVSPRIVVSLRTLNSACFLQE